MKESVRIEKAWAAGVVGAAALTLLHESVRRVRPDAPRMDRLGMRALAGGLRAAEVEPPPEGRLHTLALAGDLLANSLYYSLVGVGPAGKAWRRGIVLGLAAGAGAVVLPPVLGLGSRPSRRTTQTKAMTVAWYAAGGLAAAAASRLLAD